MNASLGIVLRKSDREKVLSALPPRLRTWGSEIVEEEGPQRFSAFGLDGVEFRVNAVTKFIRGRLPANERTPELEYAGMTGPALDAYEVWAKSNSAVGESHVFETGLTALLVQLSFWALMFAPENDRLGAFVTVDACGAVHELRRGARDVVASKGFLAMSA
jgi:hypothetical protein